MISFVEKLQKEIRQEIQQIEAEDKNILKKSLDASHVLGNAFDRLKEFIITYRFQDEDEEILFFKEVKPRIFCHLIYYRKVYNIEMHRPVASMEAQKEYLKKKLDVIQSFNDKILDFYRYYRSGATFLDAAYFVRGQPDIEQYLETFYYERDPQFSTNADFKVAKIMANDMLQAYLLSELDALDNNTLNTSNTSFPKVKLTWTGSKTDLIELIYSLDTEGCFNEGKVPLIQIAAYFESIFNINLGNNIARNFYDMRIRNQPTPFLDRLREEIRKRMDNTKPGGKDKDKGKDKKE
ncbi:RteC protein [Dysgonomonas sp. 521]|uniref:RteC domain-containing protein n=1 Tax=Dysgonomonas sp. 521 TaxID=2302932 RepID=UPI0013D66F5A|nr:RteC domain-containing protein [Dysgonomonas sp. 521]NDV97460.1 RteC protein [Dysgonomonas sp. 521]